MFLGIFSMDEALDSTVQLRNGNVPVSADSDQALFRIYKGTTLITTGTSSNAIDGQTGWVNINKALTAGNGFSVGRFRVRVSYNVSSVAKVQDYSFQIT